jgi:hypothetical protein
VTERIIWFAGITVLCLILLRGLQAALLQRYRLFYIQAFCVLVSALYLNPRVWGLPSYAKEYWPVQFLTMLLASGIILETLNHVLFLDPRSQQFARFIRLVLFAAASSFAFAFILGGATRSLSGAMPVYLERDFRLIQALLLLAIGGTVAYFGISMGKNLQAMFLGYGIYVAASLIILAFHAYQGGHFNTNWFTLQPLAYDISLIVWAVGLWSYSPPCIPCGKTELETKVRVGEHNTQDGFREFVSLRQDS